jgi:hypothetical protein
MQCSVIPKLDCFVIKRKEDNEVQNITLPANENSNLNGGSVITSR